MAKAIRRRGGDQELCRLGLQSGLSWFPLEPARLPNLRNDMPDPFAPRNDSILCG